MQLVMAVTRLVAAWVRRLPVRFELWARGCGLTIWQDRKREVAQARARAAELRTEARARRRSGDLVGAYRLELLATRFDNLIRRYEWIPAPRKLSGAGK